MESILFADFPFDIDTAELMSRLHIEEDDEDAAMVREMAERFLKAARPKAVYRLCAVGDNNGQSVAVEGVRIPSRLVAKNLAQRSRCVAFVATCGREAETLAASYSDVFESYCADQIMLTLVGEASKALTAHISERYFDKRKLSRMSPGSLKEYPICEQVSLFDIIGDVTDKTGVRLTDSFLMLPHKSVSGLFFDPDKEYVNCVMCPLLNCPNRQQSYDAEHYARIYGKD